VSRNEHADNGAPTPEATPRQRAAGAGGAATSKTFACAVCAAKLRQTLQLFKGTSPRGHLTSVQMKLVTAHVPSVFSCCDCVASPQATVWAPARAPRSSTCDAQRAAPRATACVPRLMSKALRCTTSATAGNSLGTTIKYLLRTASGAAGSSLGTTAKYL